MSIASVASGIAVTCCVIIAAAMAPRVLAAELFPWHPVLMTVGFLGFMHQGIMKAYRLRSSDGSVRVAGLQAHLWIQLASVLCTFLGFLTIYLNKELHGKPHFLSLHGKVGVMTTVSTLIAPALGILSFRKLGLISLLPAEWQAISKWFHRLTGVFTWSLGLVVMQLALPNKGILSGLLCRLWQGGVAFVALSSLWLLRQQMPGKPVLPEINFTAIPQSTKHL